MSVTRLQQAMRRDFLLDLSAGFLSDCLDWKSREPGRPAAADEPDVRVPAGSSWVAGLRPPGGPAVRPRIESASGGLSAGGVGAGCGLPGRSGPGQGGGDADRRQVRPDGGVPEPPGGREGADEQPHGADQPPAPAPLEVAVQVAAATDDRAVRDPGCAALARPPDHRGLTRRRPRGEADHAGRRQSGHLKLSCSARSLEFFENFPTPDFTGF